MSSNSFDIQDWMFMYIDHLNISRHHHDDVENAERFRTKSVADFVGLKSICERANYHGVDVTLNCVLPGDFSDLEFVNEYIDFAKLAGANAVCFRKVHGTLDDLPVEAAISAKVIREGGCPACRSKVRLMKGMQITWRYGVLEPSTVMPRDGVYELVLQQDGRLTKDWEGDSAVRLESKKRRPQRVVTDPELQGCDLMRRMRVSRQQSGLTDRSHSCGSSGASHC